MLERIIAAVEAQPWAIHPDKLRVIEAVIARHAAGGRATDTEIEAAKSAAKKDRRKQEPKGVGIIPIYGTITQRADWLSEWSGGTSTDRVGQWLDEAAADPQLEAIVLDVDSPGGGVYGVGELGDKIREVGRSKKVIAVANSVAASAAYWLASQANELVVTPNGEIGSIGVYLMHVDVSEAMKTYGRKVSYISAGERKVFGNPYEPLGDAARAELQKGVDDYYDKFVRAVARGRGTTLTAVRDGFGRGGVVRAEEAIREGMADKVGTLEQVLARYGVSLADAQPAAQSDRSDVEIRRRRLEFDLRDD